MDWYPKNVTSIRQLSERIPIDQALIPILEEITQRFPISIPEYYLSLIDPDDPFDPIRRMCVPSPEENIASGTWDTSGEHANTVTEGLQHKYSQTALVLSTHQCAMYCRHCFRKRMVGYSENEVIQNFEAIIQYIRAHPTVDNVLLSGGDALFIGNHVLRTYLERLSSIKQLNFIRIGTRVPATLPQRITEDLELLDILRRCAVQKPLYLSTQFNHPHELTKDAQKCVQVLMDCGIVVSNQAVLLHDVNDNADTLAALMNGLTRIGVIPYYVFQCRPVRHVQTSFQMPLWRGYDIVEQAKIQLNGYAKRFRFVLSHRRGKIEILGRLQPDQMLFKFHQARNAEDHGKVFSLPVQADQTWLDENMF